MRNVFGKNFGKPYSITLRPNLARKTHRSSIAFSFHRSPAVPSCGTQVVPHRREAEKIAQTRMKIQRISFKLIIMHIKIGIFY